MNRFRTKRRAKEEAAPRPSQESESGPFRMFTRSKKSHEEVKKPIDLVNALPPTDDFRTSLLMTGLSQRFSMLREQDDPTTKIGKASDDSVLYPPKRQSRLGEFGFAAGLSDIAEVESIRAPPSFTRIDSYHSADDAEPTGSILNRGKPTDGNVLFGGRQKIYRIPAGGKNSNGGLGKALYEDDVALSSFQKWKKAEKERGANAYDEQQLQLDDGISTRVSSDNGVPRIDSPPPIGYNHKRETNSTTSSAPSGGRDSTAATSFVSQLTPSVKDWHPTSSSPTPVFEKSVARTRRLYEQGLSNELHEQQSSALTRLDTISRRFGSRTPELSQGSSPTGLLFADRGTDRRLLTKASAPNLSSAMTPPLSGMSPIPSLETTSKRMKGSQGSTPFGGAPPLSPPISDTEEQPVLSIQESDRGKATATGMFQKPSQPYDESRYAQRQIQLQQGRETPTQRFRAESNASFATARSTSTTSTHAPAHTERTQPPPAKSPEPTVWEEVSRGTFLAGPEDSPPTRHAVPVLPVIERPSDLDHPALRSTSALPSPSFPPPRIPSDSEQSESDKEVYRTSLDQSPTLGPSGLSGMVRQHLRADSNGSSVYEVTSPSTHPSTVNVRAPEDRIEPLQLDFLGDRTNPWEQGENDWSPALAFNTTKKDDALHANGQLLSPESLRSYNASARNTGSTVEMEKEHDEFQNQLSDAARRVRERLTSYVESDGRSSGPGTPGTESPTPRPNPLGILKSKSSRGSLIDRGREPVGSSKAMKMLGIGSSTISSNTATGAKQSFEERDPLSPMQEASPKVSEDSNDRQEAAEPDNNRMHAGLKQFRQARRELQKLREKDTLQRHHTPQDASDSPPRNTRAAPRGQRTPSRERKPPPVLYQQRPYIGDDNSHSTGPQSRSASRTASDRERSGSETSSGSRGPVSAPPRPRLQAPVDDQGGYAFGAQRQGPNTRSPGLPGTDIRRSPIMPPQPYPGNNPAGQQSLTVGTARRRGGPDGGPLSPISPMSGLPSPYASSVASTPTGPLPSPRRPSPPSAPGSDANANRLDESMKRVVKKRDISEPKFVSTTSRVPTVDLPEQSGTRSRSGSRSRAGSILGSNNASVPNLAGQGLAPPLPPINPKRRNVLGGLVGRRESDMSHSSPHLAIGSTLRDRSDESRSAFPVSNEDDSRGEPGRVRKAVNEAALIHARANTTQRRSPPYSSIGRLAPAAAPSNNGLPGGMI